MTGMHVYVVTLSHITNEYLKALLLAYKEHELVSSGLYVSQELSVRDDQGKLQVIINFRGIVTEPSIPELWISRGQFSNFVHACMALCLFPSNNCQIICWCLSVGFISKSPQSHGTYTNRWTLANLAGDVCIM